MKKILTVTLSLLFLLGGFSLTAFAEDAAPLSAEVFVTISDKGALVVTQEKITVTDRNNDGVLDIDEALYAAHEAKYEGSAAGYITGETEWGVSILTLWGDDSGNFSYYLNNEFANGLTDSVTNGDSLYAYVFADSESGEFPTYCYFDKSTAETEVGEEITLTLHGIGFDDEYNTVILPIIDAVITVNGERTTYKTDSDGKVTVTLDAAGDCVISAVSDTQVLVPPVCTVSVAGTAVVPPTDTPNNGTTEPVNPNPPAESTDKTTVDNENLLPKTGERTHIAIYTALFLLSLCAAVITAANRKANEA